MQEKFQEVLALARDNIANFGGNDGNNPLSLEDELLLQGGGLNNKPKQAKPNFA